MPLQQIGPPPHNQSASTITPGTFQAGTYSIPGQLNVDNLRLDGNVLSATNTDGGVSIAANGVGTISLTGPVSADTSLGVPQINVGDLSLSGSTIISTDTDGDITLTPDGSGSVFLHGVEVASNDAVAGVTLLSVDNLRLDGNTLSSTDTNGNINLTPNGSGLLTTGSGGLDINPGSDADADLLTVGVTGSPRLWWDESDDRFTLTHGLDVDAGLLKVADATASTSTSTGCATFAGGIGVAGTGYATRWASNAAGGGTSAALYASSSIPGWALNQENAGTDEKLWDCFANGGQLFARAVNDANTLASNWMTVSRSGITVSEVKISATTVHLDGTAKFGTHTALGGESVTGYITITDAGGTSRKIAVVS